jgi:opine dehydrogenase
VLVHPGNPGGAFVVANTWKKMKIKREVHLCEAPTLLYATRKTEPSAVWIRGYKKNFNIAVFPAKNTQTVLKSVREAYPEFGAEKNIFITGMSNPNTVQHVPPTILNAGWIESTKGDFYFYRQGVSPATARVIEAIEKERIAIGKAMGIPLTPMKNLLLRWYGHQGAKGENMQEILNNNPPYQPSRGPKNLEARYVTEDIPFGLVPLAAFGKLVKVPTPASNLMIDLACLETSVDLRQQGRTLEHMGIAKKTPAQIRRYLEVGLT